MKKVVLGRSGLKVCKNGFGALPIQRISKREAVYLLQNIQAIVNNFAPLLFLTFQGAYGIPLSQITLLVTFNFGIQLVVDLLSSADIIPYFSMFSKKTVIQ